MTNQEQILQKLDQLFIRLAGLEITINRRLERIEAALDIAGIPEERPTGEVLLIRDHHRQANRLPALPQDR